MQGKVVPYIFWCTYSLAKSDNEKVQKKINEMKYFVQFIEIFHWSKVRLSWCYIKRRDSVIL